MNQFAIFGNSGFAKEVRNILLSIYGSNNIKLINVVESASFNGEINEADYKPEMHGHPIIAIGNPVIRQSVVRKLKIRYPLLDFPNIIHPTVCLGENVQLGKGIIIAQNCVLTVDISVGDFTHLNIATTIGHDVILGSFFTSAPGVHINGNVSIDSAVYFGSNSATIERLSICSGVTVGAGAVVITDIKIPGTYVGIPAKILKKE